MDKEFAEWLREDAHKLVQIARNLTDSAAASKLEEIALEMLSRALVLEKAGR